MQSIWKENGALPKREPLQGERKVDIAVIGGGMTGILTAYFLMKKGAKVLVLEQDRVGMGATGNTTAKVTSSHNLIYEKLMNRFGVELARKYGELQEMAIEGYARLIQEKQIECQWERRDHYVYTQKDPTVLHGEVYVAKRLGLPAVFTQKTELPFPVTGAVKFEHQAQFHPLKFLSAIAKEVDVCEETPVLDVQGQVIRTSRGTVTAQQVVVASHYPFLNVPGYYFLREYQKKSYVLALRNAQKMEGMYIGAGTEGYSFRPYQDMLLFGGDSSRTGKHLDGMVHLQKKARALYPDCHVVSAWENQDCVTLDGLPYVGRYSKKISNLYVATGYDKWGMTQSMAAALLLSKELAGERWDYSDVFSPQRKWISATIPAFLGHAAETAAGLVRGVFMKPSCRCTHLGCGLHWNAAEQVYECRCHGSRFDKNGKRLVGPAESNLKKDR